VHTSLSEPGGTDKMQATAEYLGNEQRMEVGVPGARTREMEDILSRRLPSLYRNAYRFLGNAADAEDAVQDALLSAYKHLDQFKGQAQMSTWLTAIVTNCARMQLRRRPRHTTVSLDERFGEQQEYTEYTLSEILADRGPSPEDESRITELRLHILRFVEQLSPCLRKAFQLRELDGLSISEAAHILGVPEGTVKAQLARARAKLRRLLCRAFGAKPSLASPNMFRSAKPVTRLGVH
jgi:RNA polymerase sigma-70 factor, ECF subfamily